MDNHYRAKRRRHIKADISQGSIFGPLLFLIDIKDITLVTHIKMKLFAEGTSIYVEFIKPSTALSSLRNEDLKENQNWADQWLVTFSTHKTTLLTCSIHKI